MIILLLKSTFAVFGTGTSVIPPKAGFEVFDGKNEQADRDKMRTEMLRN